MSLVTAWSPFFPPDARMRGRALQLAEAVTLLDPRNGELLRAEVEDEEHGAQTVQLQRDDKAVTAECGCELFDGGTYCPHIWSVLLTLQESPDRPEASAVSKLKVRSPRANKRVGVAAPKVREPAWATRLTLLRPAAMDQELRRPALVAPRKVYYLVEREASARHHGLFVEVWHATPTASGWSKPKLLKLSPLVAAGLPDAVDRRLCAMILGSVGVVDPEFDAGRGERSANAFRLPAGVQRELLERLCATGRCFVDDVFKAAGAAEKAPALRWESEAWRLWLSGEQDDTGEAPELVLDVELRRGEHRMRVHKPGLMLGGPEGLIVHGSVAAPFDDRDAWRWASQFRDAAEREEVPSPIRVPLTDVDRFFDRLYLLTQLPEIDLPEELGPREVRVQPQPVLELFSPGTAQAGEFLSASTKNQVLGRVHFRYGAQRVSPATVGRFVPVLPESVEVKAEEAVAEASEVAGAGAQAPTEVGTPVAAAPEAQSEDEEAGRRLIRRQLDLEREALEQLIAEGMRPVGEDGGDALTLPSKRVGVVVARLASRGWRVQADQRVVRAAGTPSLSVTSGIDWFELRGGVKFTLEDGRETVVSLPEVLAAARQGKQMIELSDGTQGLLPEEWLAEHGLLTSLGVAEGDALRFKASQAGILDALLRDQELESVDAEFEAVRQRLHQFDGVHPLEPAGGFEGTLRAYQGEGLGWLGFQRWMGTGGILADDMGLGKTVQVLAMLHGRVVGDAQHTDPALSTDAEEGTPPKRPSLIVAPRSVLFNWMDEAEKFTPGLRVAAYTGAERHEVRDRFDDVDVVVTTYGLMRRDIEELMKYRFDYVVLDEAQAIKNPASQSAKAARLLDANHRLALTGTPVENHLGDLWSIFEFLNRGMLGTNSRFADLIRQSGVGADDPVVPQVARALRPFILRRTKEQVLQDLPAKTEQTIVCEMEPAQRAVYDELKAYYRGNLMQKLDEQGVATGATVGRSAFMVLEALLRLRQASCHPGLIDDKRRGDRSAKLDVLYDRLADVVEEGSKALVFSQFTSMLSIVKDGLNERGIPYCYLDGQTRDRREVVDTFQNDSSIPVFLISLKAGGFGLNLTAAEYVFILDPWWNPAVEAQAIDRTHRIGQTKPVFAYRLVCKDTVEQRILDLQRQKRELADAIVGGEQNPLRHLSREDLESLLA